MRQVPGDTPGGGVWSTTALECISLELRTALGKGLLLPAGAWVRQGLPRVYRSLSLSSHPPGLPCGEFHARERQGRAAEGHRVAVPVHSLGRAGVQKSSVVSGTTWTAASSAEAAPLSIPTSRAQ